MKYILNAHIGIREKLSLSYQELLKVVKALTKESQIVINLNFLIIGRITIIDDTAAGLLMFIH